MPITSVNSSTLLHNQIVKYALVIANQDTAQLSPKQLWRQLQADLPQAIFEFGYWFGFADTAPIFMQKKIISGEQVQLTRPNQRASPAPKLHLI